MFLAYVSGDQSTICFDLTTKILSQNKKGDNKLYKDVVLS